MTHNERIELVMQTIKWYEAASREIGAVGGHAPSVIALIPYELILTLISNELYIKRK